MKHQPTTARSAGRSLAALGLASLAVLLGLIAYKLLGGAALHVRLTDVAGDPGKLRGFTTKLQVVTNTSTVNFLTLRDGELEQTIRHDVRSDERNPNGGGYAEPFFCVGAGQLEQVEANAYESENGTFSEATHFEERSILHLPDGTERQIVWQVFTSQRPEPVRLMNDGTQQYWKLWGTMPDDFGDFPALELPPLTLQGCPCVLLRGAKLDYPAGLYLLQPDDTLAPLYLPPEGSHIYGIQPLLGNTFALLYSDAEGVMHLDYCNEAGQCMDTRTVQTIQRQHNAAEQSAHVQCLPQQKPQEAAFYFGVPDYCLLVLRVDGCQITLWEERAQTEIDDVCYAAFSDDGSRLLVLRQQYESFAGSDYTNYDYYDAERALPTELLLQIYDLQAEKPAYVGKLDCGLRRAWNVPGNRISGNVERYVTAYDL